ncbi:hypothetical protein HMPREF3152_08580 [Actinomyces sp. HMSC06A08]|nr:hypothetical protein HMPREF3152_08580 [Actinomyces sp. HMSC06A08]
MQSIESIYAQAQARNLDAEATNYAIRTQQVINAYHALPEALRHRPLSDPAVQKELNHIIFAQTGNRWSLEGTSKAFDCLLAVADAASIAVPGAQYWKWIKAAGGVITVAEAINDYLKSKTEKAFIKVVGKEFGKFLKKVLAVQHVKESCFKAD